MTYCGSSAFHSYFGCSNISRLNLRWGTSSQLSRAQCTCSRSGEFKVSRVKSLELHAIIRTAESQSKLWVSLFAIASCNRKGITNIKCSLTFPHGSGVEPQGFLHFDAESFIMALILRVDAFIPRWL